MDFTVHTTQDNDSYSGDATYKVEGSVLTVDDGHRRVIYSPMLWQRVVQDRPEADMVDTVM